MAEDRDAHSTPIPREVTPWVPRLLLQAALALGLGVALLVSAGSATAKEPVDTDRLLFETARSDLPLAQRLKAAGRVLARRETVDADLAVRAGAALLPDAAEPAAWLILRGSDAGFVGDEMRKRGVAAVQAAWQSAQAPAERARLAAVGWLLGHRAEPFPAAMTAVWPLPDLVRAVLRREIGHMQGASGAPALAGGAAAVRLVLEESAACAALLDKANRDDPAQMRAGLDGLVDLGSDALPLLLHEAESGAAGAPAGRMPRAARAIVVLGQLHDRRATPVLARCLTSTDGWVRAAAAGALGDLGDPAGAVPLAVGLATLGDLFRARDQWDYPGTSETTVPEADWRRVDYFAVDCAAADALLRLGIPNAAGYLIHDKLDPSKSNSRIRVFQDAVDALRRSMPDLDATQYNVDAGLPQRDAAFAALATRWRVLRDTLTPALDETDANFRKEARALAEKLRGTDVRTFMITKPACALLGRTMTPTLIETLQVATKGSARAELAETLGLVRDPRAIPTLLGLLKDERPFVRARAAEALGVYVDGSEEVRRALLQTLRDPKEGARISALKGLVAAPRSADVLAAVQAARPQRVSKDWAMAETAVLLVQEGPAHWDTVAKGLASEHRYIREAWWRMLRTALDWPAYLHAAKAKPATRHVRRVTKAMVLERLAGRRAR